MSASRAFSVYRFYDEAGDPIYVGTTSRGLARVHNHQTMKAWWPRVSRIEVEHFATKAEMLERERYWLRRQVWSEVRGHRNSHRREILPIEGVPREHTRGDGWCFCVTCHLGYRPEEIKDGLCLNCEPEAFA